MILASLILLECILLVIAIRKNYAWIEIFVITNFLLVNVTASSMLYVNNMRISVASVCTAAVFGGYMALLHNYGLEKLKESILLTYYSGIIAFLFDFILNTAAKGMNQMFAVGNVRGSLAIAGLSAISFGVAQAVVVYFYTLLEAKHFAIRYVTSMVIGETVRSAIFAPLLFNQYEFMRNLLLVSLAVKVFVGIFLMPIIYFIKPNLKGIYNE
jgi:hypothetical protein